MDNDQDKQIIRRYLNGTYSSREAEKIAESLNRADERGILDDLATEVWEEAESSSAMSHQNEEQYRKEAK